MRCFDLQVSGRGFMWKGHLSALKRGAHPRDAGFAPSRQFDFPWLEVLAVAQSPPHHLTPSSV